MKRSLFLCAAVLALSSAGAQQPAPDASQTSAAAQSQAAPDAAESQREAQFRELLGGGVTLEGRWCLVEEGELTEERSESYRILSIHKAGGDIWVIRAAMKFGDREVTVPVPVSVKWAGDTPVITVTEDSQITGLGRYTARVVLHDGTYAGTWSGGDKKGLLHGIIKK